VLKVDQNSVEARPATGERFRAADFGSAGQEIARGASNLAQGLGQAAENIDKINEIYDTAAIKRADAEDLKQIMDIRATALQSTGFDAQDAVADARTKIADIRKARLSTLKTGRQQKMYSDVFDQRNLQLEESFSNHLAKQITEANRGAAQARAEVSRDAAIDSFGTPEFENNLATAESEAATINKGLGNVVIGLAQAKLRSQVYTGVIDNMIADPNRHLEAKHVLDEHAGDILPGDETTLRKKLNPLLEEDQTESDAGWAFTNSPVAGGPDDPLGPLPDAKKGEEYYPTEGPETPPRSSITGPSSHAPPIVKPISPADPLRGAGRVTNTAAQHRARRSGNALDIAAKAGTPIYAPMSGKVIKSWWSKEGGWSLLIEHPNGYVTGYAHMRAQSPLQVGQEVDRDIPIGSVGMTGEKATGPHVHYTVRQSRAGPKVDPNAVDWGQTVKPESVDWKEGPLVKYDAEENSLGRALERIHQRATAENWSPRRYQNAVARVRQIAGVQNELYNQQQENRWNEALKTVVALDDNLTSVSQIPNFGLLDPAHQLSIKGIIKQNLNPSEEGKANGEVFLDLIDMSIDPARREQFIGRLVNGQWQGGVDLLKETRITRGERARLVTRQLQLRQEPDGVLSGHLDDAWSAANRYLPAKTRNNDGFSADQRRLFTDRYMEAIEKKQGEVQRPLTDRERDDIARGLIVPVIRVKQGQQVGKGMLFEYRGGRGREQGDNLLVQDFNKTYSQIAPETVARIEADLKRRGHSANPEDVVHVFLSMTR